MGGTYAYFDGLSASVVVSSAGICFSVSLKPGFSLTDNGDGSVTDPYIVD